MKDHNFNKNGHEHHFWISTKELDSPKLKRECKAWVHRINRNLKKAHIKDSIESNKNDE